MKKQFSPSVIAIGAGILVVLAASVFFALQQSGVQKNRGYDESKFLSYAYILRAKNVDFFVMKTREDYLETVWQDARSNIRVTGFVQPADEEEGDAEEWLVFDEEVTLTPGQRYAFPIPKIDVQGAFTFSAIPTDDEELATREPGDPLPERLVLSHFLFDDEPQPVSNSHFPIFDAIERELIEEGRIQKQSAEKTPAQKEGVGMKAVAPTNTCIDRNGRQVPCANEQPEEPVADDDFTEFFFFFNNEDNEVLLESILGTPVEKNPDGEFFSEEFNFFFDSENYQELLHTVLNTSQEENALRYYLPKLFPAAQNPDDASSSVLKYLDEALVIS